MNALSGTSSLTPDRMAAFLALRDAAARRMEATAGPTRPAPASAARTAGAFDAVAAAPTARPAAPLPMARTAYAAQRPALNLPTDDAAWNNGSTPLRPAKGARIDLIA